MATPEKEGLFESVNRLTAHLLSMGQTRLRIAATELEIARNQSLLLLLLMALAILCLSICIILATMLVLMLFWEAHKFTLLLGLVLFFGVSSVLLGWWIVRKIKAMPALFSASIAELKKDQALLEAQLSKDEVRKNAVNLNTVNHDETT